MSMPWSSTLPNSCWNWARVLPLLGARCALGLLLCKNKNKVVAEYALRNSAQPIGVAEYQLVESLPPELQTSLPSIEQIERELGNKDLAKEDDS